ncbi:MAG: DUF4040 domain-containing protein [Planctomycetota bacterium]|nr:DUF4040 domain-containing protein [Planctomycetota bacterium]
MEVLILAVLVGLAIAAVRVRDLMAAVAILGAYSLMMALLWCQMNALDVGFTEASVGAGISTVLMLAALGRIGRREEGPSRAPLLRLPLLTMKARLRRAQQLSRQHHRASAWGAVLVCVLVGALLLYGTRDMPQVGDPDSPANRQARVAQYYLTKSRDEVGPANMVTSVLGDYRGYDTMGETVVIFTAALCVLMLLREAVGRGRRERDA